MDNGQWTLLKSASRQQQQQQQQLHHNYPFFVIDLSSLKIRYSQRPEFQDSKWKLMRRATSSSNHDLNGPKYVTPFNHFQSP